MAKVRERPQLTKVSLFPSESTRRSGTAQSACWQTAPPPLPLTSHSLASVWSNFSWALAGNVIYAACQWGMLVVLAKLGSAEMIGQFALALAVASPVFVFANLQLRAIQATDAKREYVFGHYLIMRAVTTLLGLLLIGTIAGTASFRQDTRLVILVVAMMKAVESFSDIFHGRLQGQERMSRVGLSLMGRGSLSLLALGAGLYMGAGLISSLLAVFVTWIATLLLYDARRAARDTAPTTKCQPQPSSTFLGVPVQPAVLLHLLGLALPLGFAAMLGSLVHSIPRFFLEHCAGERELGVFAAIASLMLAGNQVVAAVGQSISPRIARLYATGDHVAFRRLTRDLVLLGAAMGGAASCVAWVAGEEILTICFRPEYARHAAAFVWLMVASSAFNICFFLNWCMVAARRAKAQLLIALGEVVTATLAGWTLIPAYGLSGAAWTVVLIAFCQLALSALVMRQIFRDRPSGGVLCRT